MQRSLLFKISIVGLLTIMLFVPLGMIQNTIWERVHYRDDAVRSIAAESVGEQIVLGPVLIVPYTEKWEEETPDKDGKKNVVQQRSASKKLYVYPNEMQVKGNLDTDQRYRGIHKVLVYSGTHLITGDFILPNTAELIPADKNKASITFSESPYISLGLSDTRGLRNYPKLEWDGKTYEFTHNSKLASLPQGIHSVLKGFQKGDNSTVKFKLELMLDGIEKLSFVPVARNNQVTLTSSWPHLQYGGRFLPSPKGRTTSPAGVSVNWNISSLSSNAQQQLDKLDSAGEAIPLKSASNETAHAGSKTLDMFSISLIEPINNYSQADRAVKYGLMFIGLTFAAFFLFEVLKQLPIHPVQYTLVGLALVIFFLLLVSLSEKISFALAYLTASTACILLIGIYLANVLHDWKRGFGFACALTVLYGILFGLLNSESNAMMMGSLLLFAVLSGIMIATRKVDWYNLSKPVTDSAWDQS